MEISITLPDGRSMREALAQLVDAAREERDWCDEHGRNGPSAIPVTELAAIVAAMRSLGVKRLAMNAGQIYEVALFEGTT
jgi:hypothetical protein